MTSPLPELYFRVRDNGAQVFRVETENRHRRIEMEQIAVVNIKSGDIKVHGEREISDNERAEIEAWIARRRDVLKAREVEDILRTVDRLNLTTAWLQQKADPEEIEAVADPLLMAMHDLRSVIVRKKADRLKSEDE